MEALSTIAYMLVQDQHILTEKRRPTRRVCPGVVAIPGGHVEDGESIEAALKREVCEELSIDVQDFDFVCTLLHRSQEFRKLNYFVIHSWHGEIRNNEAEALLWIPLDNLNQLDLDVDRVAVSEYLRVYGNNF